MRQPFPGFLQWLAFAVKYFVRAFDLLYLLAGVSATFESFCVDSLALAFSPDTVTYGGML